MRNFKKYLWGYFSLTLKILKNFLLDVFFPKFCLGCGKEKTWLCQDCQALLEIQEENFCPVCGKTTFNFKTHKFCKRKTNLEGLFWAVDYNNPLVKKLILKFKYTPFAKELAQPLARVLISHFLLTGFFRGRALDNSEFVLVPIPLSKKRLKWRGFNQAEEISKEISRFFQLPVENFLIREKEREPQMKIQDLKKRKENIKGVFSCHLPEKVKGKKILLIDDVCTTRATLKEATKVLKKAGAKQVWGAVIAFSNKT